MTTGEREMVRKLLDEEQADKGVERFTSLQPTYEDSVPPEDDECWKYKG